MTLQKYLAKNNITQSEFATQVQCTDSMICRICIYHQRPGVDLAKRIESATDGHVSAIELLGLSTQQAAA